MKIGQLSPSDGSSFNPDYRLPFGGPLAAIDDFCTPESEAAHVKAVSVYLDTPYRYDALYKLNGYYSERTDGAPGKFDPDYARRSIDCIEAMELLEPDDLLLRRLRYVRLLDELSYKLSGSPWFKARELGLEFSAAVKEQWPALRELIKEASQLLELTRLPNATVIRSLTTLLDSERNEAEQLVIDIFLLPSLRAYAEKTRDDEAEKLLQVAGRHDS